VALIDSIEKIVNSHGAKLYDSEIVQENGETIYRLYILKDGGVNIGGYFIKPVRSGYKDKDGKFVKAIPDKILKAVDKSAPFRLRYLAIDDVRSGLKAMPIFVAQKIDRNITLEAQSKPLVIPVPDAIVDVEIA